MFIGLHHFNGFDRRARVKLFDIYDLSLLILYHIDDEDDSMDLIGYCSYGTKKC